MNRTYWEDTPEAEPYLLSLARLTLTTRTLEHQLTEMGLALGVDVDAEDPLEAVRVLREQLEDLPVPPWAAPEASKQALQHWLTSVAECLRKERAFTSALHLYQGSPQLMDGTIGLATTLSREDFDQLTHRCRDYAEHGTDLLEALAMRTESGGHLSQYFAISRALWSALNDEPGVRPATRSRSADRQD